MLLIINLGVISVLFHTDTLPVTPDPCMSLMKPTCLILCSLPLVTLARISENNQTKAEMIFLAQYFSTGMTTRPF